MTSFGRRTHKEKVYLNVYDLGAANDSLIYVGLGLYHSGVEVHGVEYTFGSGSGVFSHAPKGAPNVPLRATILLGETIASSREVESVVSQLKPEWPGRTYHLLRRNCNHFADELVIRLLGARIPGWVNRMSAIGQSLSCLLPESAFGGGAPVDGGAANGGDEGEDTSGGGRSFQVHAPRGRSTGGGGPSSAAGSAGAAVSANSAGATSGRGYTLSSSSSTTTTGSGPTMAVRPPAPSNGSRSAAAPASDPSASRPSRDALVAAAMRRLQAQAVAEGAAGGDREGASLLAQGR